MKATSATTLTLALIASLLTGSGICVALRHSADARRASEARTAASAPVSNKSSTLDRDTKAQRTTRTRITDREDFRLRLTTLLSSSDPTTRSQNLLDLLDGLSPADFPIVIQEMQKICRNGDPMLALVFASWAEVDPAAALRQELESKSLMSSNVSKVWAQRDPVAALDCLVEMNGDDKGVRWVLQALAIFANDDPAAAIAWVKNRNDPSHARLATVLRYMLPKHLEKAIHEFSQLPAETRQSLVSDLSKQIARLGTAARQQWIESLTTGEAKADAVATMIPGIVSLDERLALLAEYPAALNSPAAGPLYQEWVKQDQTAAIASLESIPAGPNRDAAIGSTIKGICQKGDPRKALDLMNLYPGAITETMLGSWVSYTGINHREWDLILDTLPRVGNEQSRIYLYHIAFREWIRIDQESARASLASHPEVPATVRAAYATP